MFIALCDNINQRYYRIYYLICRGEEYRSEVLSALDSRLKSSYPQTVTLAICLLDTLEKNCFGPFHKLVCKKEFLDNLFKIAMKEQVLSRFFDDSIESRKC